MRKYFLNFFTGVVGIALLFFASCKKNNVVLDQDVLPPAFAKFNTIQPTDTMATYYIRSTNDVYKLPIGVTTVSDKDRTINFRYTSTAIAGTQYNAPSSLIIRAGQALDSQP